MLLAAPMQRAGQVWMWVASKVGGAPWVAGVYNRTLAEYTANPDPKHLRELVRRLKATNAQLIWANTTPSSQS